MRAVAFHPPQPYISRMKSFIDQDPSDLGDAQLLSWLSEPGRFGELALGASTDLEDAWFGDEDGPEAPDEPEEGWDRLASHHGHADSAEGKLNSLTYSFRVLSPSPMCFSPEPPPNTRLEQLWSQLTDAYAATLGKPTKRTKKTQEFAWDGGEMTIERSSNRMEPWDVLELSVQYFGSAPSPSS